MEIAFLFLVAQILTTEMPTVSSRKQLLVTVALLIPHCDLRLSVPSVMLKPHHGDFCSSLHQPHAGWGQI